MLASNRAIHGDLSGLGPGKRMCQSVLYFNSPILDPSMQVLPEAQALEFVRVIWNDFEMEFGNLEAEMSKMRDRVESTLIT